MEDFKFNNIDEIKSWLCKIQAFGKNEEKVILIKNRTLL